MYFIIELLVKNSHSHGFQHETPCESNQKQTK